MNEVEQSQFLRKMSEEIVRKRALGLYPPGLEQELEYEFNEILRNQTGGHDETIQALKNMILDKLAVVDHLSMMIVELESRIVQLERSRDS